MLHVNSISKSFNRKLALDEVSLTVSNGEIVGLLGPNGAGKTTLVRIINRILTPDHGHVKINGELLSDRHLPLIGYLPEERGLYRSMTVEDHILFIGQIRGLSKKESVIQMNRWLDKFEISDWKKRRIEELSKGMAQKIQFICSVLHEPKLLILDEPLSGFDPLNVNLINQEMIEMRAEGKAIILATHNMKSVEEICDKAVLLHQSKKILEGSISEIRTAAKTGEYSIRFRGNMIAFVNALWTSFEIVDKDILGDDRFEVRVKMRGEATFEDLLRALIGQVQIEAAWEFLPSMQDIFIEQVQQKSMEHAE